jgi:prepilin-type N-terminal cleavage/methylation domain-containing protein
MKSRNISPTTAAATVQHRARSGFTLVELLTVIAIIAILAAIIFPVFNAVSENARRGNTMSNMRQLYAATKQYELDNRKYPDYLFGPALNADGSFNTDGSPGMSMADISRDLKATISGDPTTPDNKRIASVQNAYKGSLYPTYINDITLFGCPDNTVSSSPNAKNAAVVKRLFRGDAFDPNGDPTQAVLSNLAFYTYDSYDLSPAISADQSGLVTGNMFFPRYSLFWLPLADKIDDAPPTDKDVYPNQLGFKNPSAESYLMMTSYHVPKGKIIVMWLNGSVKVLDTKVLAKFPPSNEQNGTPLDFDMFRMTPTNY